MSALVWNAANYQDQFEYVWRYGESLLSQLDAQVGERILDLGCGTGQLTAQIAASGATVVGIDCDRAMVQQASDNYPDITFRVADAAHFELAEPVDAVFSNAALHWVKDAQSAALRIANALKPGGRFVAEFGGEGNVQTILSALTRVSGQGNLNPWYFPSLGEYVALLESVGFKVVFAHIFDRATPLGDAGLAGWLDMFGRQSFSDLSATEWAEMVKSVEDAVPQLYRSGENGKESEGEWIADYRRLRVVATKS
ncbi:MAG: methyltransferase domain-containing protein [Cyanobacteria bacterium P01_C01_bin.69]